MRRLREPGQRFATANIDIGSPSRKARFVGGLFGVFQMILPLGCDGIGARLFQFDLPPQPEHFFAHATERRRWRPTY